MRIRRSIGLGAAVGCVGAAALLLPSMSRLEQQAGLSALFAMRGPVEPPAEVAAVSASADSAEALGIGTGDLDEWPRSLHAELVDALTAAGARLIVLDFSFERASEPEHDDRLARALQRSGRVVLLDWTRSRQVVADGVVIAVRDERVRPIPPLGEAALATAPFVLPTVPIRTSQFWTFGRSAARLPNLPAVALQLHLASHYTELIENVCMRDVDCRELPGSTSALLASPDIAAVMARVRALFEANPGLAERVRATSASSGFGRLVDLYAGPASRYLNFYGPAGSIPTVPMHEILADPGRARDLAGKIVLVGVAEQRPSEQQDWFYTVASEQTGRNLSGVEVGATAVANLLGGDTLRLPGRPAELMLVLVFGLALGTAALPRRALVGVVAGVAAGGAYLGAAYHAFATAQLWLPLVVPLGVQWPVWLVALLALAYRDVLGQRARIEAALGRYVPRHTVRRLARESVDRGPASELLEGVCLYTDAEQFTRVSEQLAPDRLARLMSRYYDLLCTTAERHGGIVTDIAGDSMVAIWAAARPHARLGDSACAAALEILERVEDFNRAPGAGRLPTRIGLDAGRLLLGDIGSERREYRAVGEIVTTASRLQGLNRQLGTRVLVSAAVARGAHAFATRPLGSFMLLGKTVAVEVCELLGGADGAGAGPERQAEFAEALRLFARRDFVHARERLQRVAAAVPDDGPTQFYLALCDRYAAEPPPPDWSGTVRMDVK